MQPLLKRTILKPTEFKRFPIWLTAVIFLSVAAASIVLAELGSLITEWASTSDRRDE